MLITAHGGALNTGRNTPKFFQTIKGYEVDVIEVDIYRAAGTLYISHMPKLFYKRALTLAYVFDYLKDTNFKVNCDVKMNALVAPVTELAQKHNVADRLIFTGAVSRKDIAAATAGDIYLNAAFFLPMRINTENLERVKQIIDRLNSGHVKGLNLNYKKIDDAFLDKAKELGIPLSLYTVDEEARLVGLLKREELANITTNIVDAAIKSREK